MNDADSAKQALEHVCSGSLLAAASRYYSSTFVDHVNDIEFRGLAGVQRSVTFYRNVFSEIAIDVVEQVVERERIASRFVVTGTCRGRRVRFNGITISRFENGLIAEDWSVTDTAGMLRQLGFWRTVFVGTLKWRAARAARMNR